MKGVKVLLMIYFAVCVLENVSCRDFAYNGAMGPKHWSEQYSTCSGKFQSPINIDDQNVEVREFPKINATDFHTIPLHAELLNNGHTVVMRMEFADGNRPTISGGPLQGTFVFTQLHFHWGENDTIGSEDRINNKSFSAELHVVFHNTKYATFEEAVLESNGVAVMAFFFSVEREDNPHYIEFTNLLEHVVKPNMVAKFHNPPTLDVLMIEELNNYWTYIGSLTTPPCSEDVTWLDYYQPIEISPRQIEKFRRLYTHDNKPLTHNFRPLQPLNNRTVYAPQIMDIQKFDSIPFVDNLVGDAVALRPVATVFIFALLYGLWMPWLGATTDLITK